MILDDREVIEGIKLSKRKKMANTDSYTDCTYNKYNMNNENKHTNMVHKISKHIRIYSYNSRGLDEIKQKFCMELSNSDTNYFTILCNQENFVLKGNAHLIKKAMVDCHVIIKPASKANFDGRPVNGNVHSTTNVT